jgi:hypothetical protein
MTKATPQEQAQQFKNACLKYGWTYEIKSDSVIRIHKRIQVGCKQSFCDADMEYYSILSLAPLKGGSIWGTDGGGIGAISAMNKGLFTMSKSGNGGKRFMAALAKIQ